MFAACEASWKYRLTIYCNKIFSLNITLLLIVVSFFEPQNEDFEVQKMTVLLAIELCLKKIFYYSK